MRLWRLIVREVLVVLEVQIKTNTAILGRQCSLCKDGIIPLTNANPYCPDCENALSEMITWWNDTARDWWVKSNAKKDRK